MNPDTENFDSLRQLLALKRHEVPPPGYFNRFSRDVMARIKAGESGGAVGSEFSWWQRLISLFDVKPVFAGAFGTAVCAFLISGFISTEQTPAMGSATTGSEGGNLAVNVGNTPEATVADVSVSSSNAMASGSLFDQISLQPTRASDRYYLPMGSQ